MRFPSTRFVLLPCLGFALPLALPGRAGAQLPSITLTGRVLEREHTTWIGGATVRLSGRAPFITGSDGRFRFGGLDPGPYTLTVEAMGYRSLSFTMELRADTVMDVELEVDPIRLDSLLVRPGVITLEGIVRDASTGRGIPEARVRAGGVREAFTNGRGSFRIKDLPGGQAIPVLVNAYRYLPGRISLITERDTTLAVDLEADSLAIRMFAAASGALEDRTATVPLSVRVLDRAFLSRTPSRSVYDVIKWRNGGRDVATQCLFIDDLKKPHMEILDSYDASEIERIEMYRGSRMGLRRLAMIRVYTLEFVAKHLGTAKPFQDILFVPGGIGPDTCW